MTTGTNSLAPAIADIFGVPAVAQIGPNLRALAAAGPLGVVGTTVAFPGPVTATGTWVSGALRATAAGLPLVNATSTGTSLTVIGTPGGPIRVVLPDPRILAG